MGRVDEAKALMSEVIKQKISDDAVSAKRKADEAAKAAEAGGDVAIPATEAD